MAKQTLHPKSQDMSKWYTQVIQQAQLADYSPIKGCMVIRPNGYGLWENIQQQLDGAFKEMGIKNAYFPLFIPMSLLEREAEHVEGFAPELAVVTHGGGEELKEKLAVRPTSETIMYEMFRGWIHSHRDLPLLLNQWCNVVRWEKRTYFFLRTTEFLWQEGHTAHANHDEAWQMVLKALNCYRELVEDYLAIPVTYGRKSNQERFAGADTTTCIEALMPDGKALQAGTSHDLGQNFAKPFNLTFQDEQGQEQHVWQTSFGLSTRIIGAIIMAHGDDDGLVLPPKVAPVQAKVLAVGNDEKINAACEQIGQELKKAGVRAELDLEPNHSLGWKLNELELQGIPITILVGAKELAENKLTLITRYNKQKQTIDLKNVGELLNNKLIEVHEAMLTAAKERLAKLNFETTDYDQFKKIMNTSRGLIKAFWCESDECEKAIKAETKASTRCLPFIDEQGHVAEEQGKCIKCGQSATHRWWFAQAY